MLVILYTYARIICLVRNRRQGFGEVSQGVAFSFALTRIKFRRNGLLRNAG